MDTKQSESYRPTNRAVGLLHDLANLASNITSKAVVATFATSPDHLNDYLIFINGRAAEIQRLIHEIRLTSEVKP